MGSRLTHNQLVPGSSPGGPTNFAIYEADQVRYPIMDGSLLSHTQRRF